MSEQGIGAYNLLWKVERNLPAGVPVLTRMCEREDGAGYFARLSLAEYLTRQNRAVEAATLIKDAIDMRKMADQASLAPLRETLATLYEQAGDQQAALQEWRRLLPSPQAIGAVRRLVPDAMSVASAFQSARLYQETLDSLKDINLPKAAFWRARALAGLNQPEESIKEYVTYLTASPNDAQARLEYATELERAGRYTQALKEFDSLGATGLYGKGRVLAALNRRPEASQAFMASDVPDAQRRGGILLQELGDRDRALHAFVNLAGRGLSISQESAIRALSLCDSLGYAETAAQMEALLAPGSAYLRGIVKEPKAVPEPPAAQFPALNTALQIIAKLGKSGVEVALVEVEIAAPKASDAELLALGEWLIRLGETRAAIRVGAEVFRRTPSRSAYKLLYPLAYNDQVRKYSSQYSLDPYLVMAIIREESAYRPDVVSAAGAVGLMQLMPATAQQIATQLGITLGPGSLTDPESNIQLGTTYLRDLLAQFDGNIPRAVAAYNAGPHSVTRWLGTPMAKDNRYFLEAITYVETRGYLLKVMDSWRIYSWLYGGDS